MKPKAAKAIESRFNELCTDEPDISTEQAIARVADEYEIDYDDVVEALAIASQVKP